MDVKYTLEPKKPLSKKQLKEIENASKMEITYDEDSPEYSVAELEAMIRRTKELGKDRRKLGVSLRLDKESIDIAKAYGSGYTSLLARVLYYGLRDPEILRKALRSVS